MIELGMRPDQLDRSGTERIIVGRTQQCRSSTSSVLDDGAATKLLRAARAGTDPLSRLIVELLARTGIRP